jgi:hypothetical protein
MASRLLVLAGLVAGACGSGVAERSPRSERTPSLSIAAVQVSEADELTTVVALDAQGSEQARLELTHGAFTLSEPFRDDRDSFVVSGRRLAVSIRGEIALLWETEGFDPTLQLPPHPHGQWELASFLADARVQRVLGAWAVAFEPAAASADDGTFIAGSEPGTLMNDCSQQRRCGTEQIRNAVPTNCGGSGVLPTYAFRMVRANANGEEMIAQCCPAVSAAGVTSKPWFAEKLCPTASNVSSCGVTVSGACAPCPIYPQRASQLCRIAWFDTALDFCYSDSSDQPLRLAQERVPQLWPPNQRLLTIDLAACLDRVFDGCVPGLTAEQVVSSPSFHLDYIGADEQVTVDDLHAAGPHAIELRVARDGSQDGRTYHAGASYADRWGFKTSFDCRFGVPHDQGTQAVAQDRWVGPAGDSRNPGTVFFLP